MPKYNIELRTNERVWETVTIEKDGPTALRIEVAQFVGELLRDHAGKIWQDEEWRVDVTDETGLIMFIMHLAVTDAPSTMMMKR